MENSPDPLTADTAGASSDSQAERPGAPVH